MDICKLNWTSLQGRIFSLLALRAGEKLSQREIALLLKVSPTAVANALPALGELATIEKTKTINFVSFNRDAPGTIMLKRVENLRNIYCSGLVDYLRTELAGSTIILFGSYALGEDTATSDIDIAVIERTEKTLNLGKYEKFLRRPIILNFYDSWKDIHEHLKNNILNGIVLSGSVAL